MKKVSYKGKSQGDLIKTLGEKREALRKVRFGSTGSKVRSVKESSSLRKDIARVMTELIALRKTSASKN